LGVTRGHDTRAGVDGTTMVNGNPANCEDFLYCRPTN
jgi:hypothetical protein